jgi:hypothetical protein
MLRNWTVIARVTSIKSGVVIGREISGQLCCGILIYLGVYM